MGVNISFTANDTFILLAVRLFVYLKWESYFLKSSDIQNTVDIPFKKKKKKKTGSIFWSLEQFKFPPVSNSS